MEFLTIVKCFILTLLNGILVDPILSRLFLFWYYMTICNTFLL